MNLLESLLDAIVRLQGDALVLHAGEKPYVVTTSPSMDAFRGSVAWGQVELSSRVLTHELVLSMARQILPAEQTQALEELGAIEHEIPPPHGVADRFTLVTARGGDDIWLELRRHAASKTATEAEPISEVPDEARDIFGDHAAADREPAAAPADESPALELAGTLEIIEDEIQAMPSEQDVDAMLAATAAELLASDVEDASTEALAGQRIDVEAGETRRAAGRRGDVGPEETPGDRSEERETEHPAPVAFLSSDQDESWRFSVNEPYSETPATEVSASGEHGRAEVDRPAEAVAEFDRPPHPVAAPAESSEAGEPVSAAALSDAPLQKILRTATERGTSTIYVVAGRRPMARVQGTFGVLEDLPALAPEQVDRMLEAATLLDGDAPHTVDLSEWMSDIPGVGRVRCVKFHDYRGPGAIFRLVPASAVSADQLGLPREIRDLCATDGLVLLTGARASGKSTLLNGVVDLINRTRSDHVITLESRIQFEHTSERSFVSQREVGRDPLAMAAALRGALREDPDVIVIEDVAASDVAAAALDAAHAGRLVVVSLTASSPADALRTLIELFPEDERPRAQAALAADLRAVVSQILVRSAAGGRTAAREVLLNTPAVSALIQEGRPGDLQAVPPDDGHVSLDVSFASLVRDGTVHVAEGYRKASDRAAFLELLQRDGIDTGFAEKFA